MTHENMLGIIGGVIGIIMFILSMKDRGRDNGAQLARIEANGLNVNQNLAQLKGEIAEMKNDQKVSKSFRDKYEDVIKEAAKLSKDNDKAVSEIQRTLEDMAEHIDKLDKKFDKMMDVFNAKITKE